MIVKSWQNYAVKMQTVKNRQEKKKDERAVNESLNESCASEIDEAELVKLPMERKMQKRKGLLEAHPISD